jgi:hypothetical protein
MTLFERAQGFIQRRARTVALGIVPLASLGALASSAHATAVLDPATCSVSFIGGPGSATGSCSSSFISQGINLFGSGHAATSGGTLYGLLFDWTGTGSGDNVDPIPVSYNFTATPAQIGSVDYSLQFFINGQSQLTLNGSATAETNYVTVGSSALNFAGTVSSYEVKLSLTQSSFSFPNGITADVPDPNGIQITPLASTPEPVSLLLVLSGGGLMLLLSRRKHTA